MANPTIDFNAGVGRPRSRAASGRARLAGRSAPAATRVVLAPGESDAHPPEETAHWNLGPRVAVIASLAALSWLLVGGAVVWLLHH